ncbi:MAG: transcription antitermination factor NusB [Thermodesulfobacteriota bacterium]
MGKRRRARELAMQALFFLDFSTSPPEEALDLFVKEHPPPQGAEDFFFALTRGVIAYRDDLDRTIARHSQHWKLSRMSAVDRNLLRVAVFEMTRGKDVPAKVAINEAVDIGKLYGTDDTGGFLNGILDSIRAELEDPAPKPEKQKPNGS